MKPKNEKLSEEKIEAIRDDFFRRAMLQKHADELKKYTHLSIAKRHGVSVGTIRKYGGLL